MGHHVGEQQAKIGALLPIVAGHLGEQRTLAVHDLVVRDRQDEFLAPGVHERERDELVVVAPVHGIERDVLQRVVHPAHVPFEVESESAVFGRLGDAGERGRLLGDHQRAGKLAVHGGIQLAQEIDRLEILAAAVAVRQPIAGIAAVIQIQHRGHRIDAQAVDVEASIQYSALATRKLRTSWRPKLKIFVPHSTCSPRRESACS
jgi:hypothetical protein